MQKRIAFVGLGLMGGRMAANLLAKGFSVAVWNRTRARAEPLIAKGATAADSPREAANGADFVCTCVADPKAMDDVFLGDHGISASLRAGMVMIDFSTLGPESTVALERACKEHGAAFLEAPVTGSKMGAESGTLVIMCGGTEDAFTRAQPVLNAVGRKAIHVGVVGDASHVKLIGNMMIGHMLEGLHEGAALLAKAGIPLAKLLEVVQASGYASPYWDFKGRALEARDFSTHFSIDLMHKDLTLALETGTRLGVPMPGTAAVREVYALARAQGLGEQDISATAAVVDPGLLG
jgi:3-hydroxyisobutyrate dehydrogenase-like beta-hydroxyacid dehydrogenase